MGLDQESLDAKRKEREEARKALEDARAKIAQATDTAPAAEEDTITGDPPREVPQLTEARELYKKSSTIGSPAPNHAEDPPLPRRLQ